MSEIRKMTWTAEAEKELLLAVIAQNPVPIDYVAIAAQMGCTPRAVEERMKKLKKAAKDTESEPAVAAHITSKRKSGSAKTAIPKKQKTASQKPATSPRITFTAINKTEEEAIESDGSHPAGEDENELGVDEPGDSEATLSKKNRSNIQSA
ncbi:hypothetical protein MMC26_003588 [Xylographa opegraphella]|nr:hypothetical protein [Xylographa opegraphella]